jgi:hypothetical protein
MPYTDIISSAKDGWHIFGADSNKNVVLPTISSRSNLSSDELKYAARKIPSVIT